MTSTRKFRCDDLFRFNNVNLDVLTETYNMPFYLQYLTKWPDYFLLQEDPNGTMMGYVMGKAEGKGENWHGHVTAVTVAPEFRRLGLAKNLMDYLENVSVELYDGYFVDLFVRVSNTPAIGMYEKIGYSVYRRVIGYYSGDDDGEDAFDMRKALPRDKDKKSIIPLPYPTSVWTGFSAGCALAAAVLMGLFMQTPPDNTTMMLSVVVSVVVALLVLRVLYMCLQRILPKAMIADLTYVD
ncbi:N-alpha-acetyltransferase 20, NatB catalytic subunit [Aphanomyces astaci]|uniref:N-alpha-acetyltransferase 20, NatB catalytic subunit n=1 Tax=Aphanomyces astaci TaxID=112090 RepID=W4GMA9_APHAT|nr:N-alpha-acetyltransferase 20, NatB catalytic subunit [Aphanomyces astaci]ETV80023.1 N-alpha-acetyltransferase 20, NatB catalytic subunit [Aphanomyces astaci]|eukprot:XP_009830959.1 N-alpha-acetyltransferase 20, NatB catalytic subunit [Aphanomyces astaci]